MAKHYDRAAEDLGNIVMLEHVNLQIPDQAKGTLFYITGLGLTRDPYMNTGLANMWINVGKSQFHLPTGDPWVLRGAIGLVTPDRQALLKRLDGVKKQLAGTKFAVKENNDYVAVTCPWGNHFNMHSPDRQRDREVLQEGFRRPDQARRQRLGPHRPRQRRPQSGAAVPRGRTEGSGL